MAQQNQLSVNIPEADFKAIRDAIKVINDKLMPHLVNLTSDQIKTMPKLGNKLWTFVKKSYEYCLSNPEIKPAFLNIEEFKKDLTAVEELRSVLQPLEQVTDALNDTIILAGSEAYTQASHFYKTVKLAAETNVSGASTILNNLSHHFAARGGGSWKTNAEEKQTGDKT